MSVGETGAQRIECPYCGATYRYQPSAFDAEGRVLCQNCGKLIGSGFAPPDASGSGPFGERGDAINPSRAPSMFSEEAVRVKCPHCGAKYLYKTKEVTAGGHYRCQNCGKEIEGEGERVTVYHTEGPGGIAMSGALVALLIVIFLFVPLYIALPAIACILCAVGVTRMGGKEEDQVVVSKSDQGLSLE